MGLMKKKGPSKEKAKKMLEHGEVKGKPLTQPQRGLMGALARGKSKKY